MLFVLMTISGERYGVESSAVVEVVPAIELTASYLGSSPVISGELNYHGERVPVLDGGRLLEGKTSPYSLSTRIVILSFVKEETRYYFGLLAEEMTETVRLDIADSSHDAILNPVNSKLELDSAQAIDRGFRILNPYYLQNAAYGA